MKFTELKKGAKLYWVENFKVRHCTYLCVHPTGQGHYHILIDECEDPFRIHETKLLDNINQGCKSYSDAQFALSKKHEDSARYYLNRSTIVE